MVREIAASKQADEVLRQQHVLIKNDLATGDLPTASDPAQVVDTTPHVKVLLSLPSVPSWVLLVRGVVVTAR